MAKFLLASTVLFLFYQFSSASVCSSSGESYLSLLYTTKSLTSPNYPSNYPPSANCLWSLKRPSALYGVRLTFNSFYLEASSSCRYDYVEIRDGDTYFTSTIIGKFCGTGIPPMIVSRYTYIFVKFISDFDYYPSRRYFSASFKAVLKGSSTSQCSINSPFLYNNNLQLSSSSAGGTLRSPSYPFNYPNNMMCTWRITAPSGSRLMLTFNYFRLENGPCSSHDYLEVRDGSFSTSTRKGTYCGTYALNIISSGRYLWIRFRSDSSISYKGFEARYTVFSQTSSTRHVRTTSKTHVRTTSDTSKTPVGSIIGSVVGSVLTLAIIIIRVTYVLKKDHRRVTSHSSPITSPNCTWVVGSST